VAAQRGELTRAAGMRVGAVGVELGGARKGVKGLGVEPPGAELAAAAHKPGRVPAGRGSPVLERDPKLRGSKADCVLPCENAGPGAAGHCRNHLFELLARHLWQLCQYCADHLLVSAHARQRRPRCHIN